MSSNRFDVIIVGGGPAGSITAYYLAKAGVRVAVVDACAFPRSKPCGGGLQARTMRAMPFDVSQLVRGSLNRMRLTFGLSRPWTREYPAPLVYSILRSEFDHYLLLRAREAGAYIYEASTVRSVEAPPIGPVSVRSDFGDLGARFLVGADGANSLVRGVLNQRQSYFWQTAISCEVPIDAINENRFEMDAMLVDWGSLPGGYAWAFPKRGYVNVGAGGPIAIAKHLKAYARRFVEATGLVKAGRFDRLSFKGHQLPTLTKRSRLAGRSVLLVGDAAGLVEPFTGDGISFAFQSGRMASRCILGALSDGRLDLRPYESRLVAEVGNELSCARALLSISTAFPYLIYRLFRTSDHVWNTFCLTLRGEESFEGLRRDVLGPFAFAWKAVDLLMKIRERTVLSTNPILDW
jgi:geranylgeranyl reductase family protein